MPNKDLRKPHTSASAKSRGPHLPLHPLQCHEGRHQRRRCRVPGDVAVQLLGHCARQRQQRGEFPELRGAAEGGEEGTNGTCGRIVTGLTG